MSRDTDQEEPRSSSRWGSLPTEARHPGSSHLDTLATREVVELLLEEDRRGIDAALAQQAAIAVAAEWVAEALAGGGSVVFAGAGTSGRLGVLEAAECPPTFGTDPQAIRAIIAGGEDAVFRAAEGAEDRGDDGRNAASDLGPGDVLIGLSASSVTPYALGAITEARGRGARTVLLTCASAERLVGVADHLVALDTGPEILTGSTRLKAGSATKAALNAITTAAMVRLGKTFGNLMVDLRPGSAKLRDRAVRIIQAACDIPADRARNLYEEAAREVKTAIVMGSSRISADEARALLEAADGHVRKALATLAQGDERARDRS